MIRITLTVAGIKQSCGGPSRIVAGLSEALGRKGVDVHLVSLDWRDPCDPNVLPDPNLVVTTLLSVPRPPPFYRPLYAVAPYKLRPLIQFCPTGILHDNGIWLPFNHQVIYRGKQARLPIVIQVQGMLEPWAFRFKSLRKRLAWILYQRKDLQSADLLFANSTQEAQSLLNLGLHRPIACIPNGVHLPTLMEPSEKPPDAVRTALFLSRIHPKKGLLLWIQAWSKVRPTGWRLVIAGPDEAGHRQKVEKAVAEYGLERVVTFVGAVEGEAKDRLYREADIFVLPTLSENFGMVVAEALSYGIPVITTRTAPWEDLVGHRCGWWVHPDVGTLADALQQATRLSDGERQAMGRRGRRLAALKFSWETIAEQMIAVYQWLLHRGDRPDCVMFD